MYKSRRVAWNRQVFWKQIVPKEQVLCKRQVSFIIQRKSVTTVTWYDSSWWKVSRCLGYQKILKLAEDNPKQMVSRLIIVLDQQRDLLSYPWHPMSISGPPGTSPLVIEHSLVLSHTISITWPLDISSISPYPLYTLITICVVLH